MGLLPDTQNCGLCMRREYRERFPRYRLKRKLLVSKPGVQHETCVTHVPWCMSGSLIRCGGENVSGIPGACAARNFAYLVRDLWWPSSLMHIFSILAKSFWCHGSNFEIPLLWTQTQFFDYMGVIKMWSMCTSLHKYFLLQVQNNAC